MIDFPDIFLLQFYGNRLPLASEIIRRDSTTDSTWVSGVQDEGSIPSRATFSYLIPTVNGVDDGHFMSYLLQIICLALRKAMPRPAIPL